MHKALLLLGLLRSHPLSGYDIYRIVRAHGEIYSDLKKGNVYYLLDRLTVDGYLHVDAEPGARGPRGERLIYSLTDRGRAHFLELLRAVLRSYDTVHMGVDAAVMFLSDLPPDEALALLAERLILVEAYQARLLKELAADPSPGPLARVVGDHLRMLAETEVAWVRHAIAELRDSGWAGSAQHIARSPTE